MEKAKQPVLVRATRPGTYGRKSKGERDIYRAEGDVFLVDGDHKLGSWMEPVNASPTNPAEEQPAFTEEEVRTALGKLDPTSDDHWTKAGECRLEAVEKFVGKPGVSRKDIAKVWPGFNRAVALAAKSGSDGNGDENEK